MKRIIIVGGKNKAKTLAESLHLKNYEISVINSNKDDAIFLSENKNINVFLGDGTKPYVLEDANCYGADIVISLIGNDEDNLIVCELAKKKFKVKRTIALLSDAKKIDFFHKMGIDKVICAVSMVSEFIKQQALLDSITHSIPIAEGSVEVVEIRINKDDNAVGKKIYQLNLPQDVIIACILRSDTTIIPGGDDVINPNDLLIVIVKADNKFEVINCLKGDQL